MSDDTYTGKRCPACGLDLARCVRCTPAEVEAATRRKLARPPVTAPLDLEGIKASIGKPLEHSVLIHGSPRTMPDWRASLALADRDRATLVAEVERLTSERDVEKAMRVERDGLLAAERQRFAVAYDAVQQMHRERGEARAEVERLQERILQAVQLIEPPRDLDCDCSDCVEARKLLAVLAGE